MADYWDDNPPAYHVSCRYCGVDLWGRTGPHKTDCPRHKLEAETEDGET